MCPLHGSWLERRLLSLVVAPVRTCSLSSMRAHGCDLAARNGCATEAWHTEKGVRKTKAAILYSNASPVTMGSASTAASPAAGVPTTPRPGSSAKAPRFCDGLPSMPSLSLRCFARRGGAGGAVPVAAIWASFLQFDCDAHRVVPICLTCSSCRAAWPVHLDARSPRRFLAQLEDARVGLFGGTGSKKVKIKLKTLNINK